MFVKLIMMCCFHYEEPSVVARSRSGSTAEKVSMIIMGLGWMECLTHLIGSDVTAVGGGSTSDVWASRHAPVDENTPVKCQFCK